MFPAGVPNTGDVGDSNAVANAVQEQRKQQEARIAHLREEQARQIEASNRISERLQKAEEAYERRTALRAKAGAAVGGAAYAFGSLPFVGGLARIIGAGLAKAQINDMARQHQNREAAQTATTAAHTPLTVAQNVAAQQQSRAAQASQIASVQQGKAAQAGAKSAAATETIAKGAGIISVGAMALTGAAEFIRFGLGGVGKYSPATQERLEYQTDRLQAGVGKIFTPLVNRFTKGLESIGDTVFGKGFQLNNPQITQNASDIRDRLQLAAAAGAGEDTSEGGGIMGNKNTRGIGAFIGGLLGMTIGEISEGAKLGDRVEEGINNAWKGSWVQKAYRGVTSIFD